MLLLLLFGAGAGSGPIVFASAPAARTYVPPAALRTYTVPER